MWPSSQLELHIPGLGNYLSYVRVPLKEVQVKGNLKKNVSNLFSKVKGELKKISISGMMKKFTIKKTDKYSNVKLETISTIKDEIHVDEILECIDSTLEVIGNMIET